VTSESPIIEVSNLAKSFGEVTAVDSLTFTVRQGEFFGFLGPNGAGKTTTINMLTGLARPDAGAIRICGLDALANPKAVQRLIGVVPDESNLYPELTGFENLCFCAALYGLPKAERSARARDLLRNFGLAEAANRKVAGYSKGMKRRLTVAAGVIHNPRILFLDEPTTGIDVAGARQLRHLISDLHRAGTTIFLTTHYIEEAEQLCQRVAFIVGGRIVCSDSVERLLQPAQAKHILQIAWANAAPDLPRALSESFPGLTFSAPRQGLIRVEADEPIRVGPLVRFLEDRGAEVSEARKIQPSLEDVFVRLTGIEVEAMRKEKEKAGPPQ